jgi:DNA-binding NarL/FixJ family response regulator
MIDLPTGIRKRLRQTSMHQQATKNILLVDDHPIILEVVSAAIMRRFPGACVKKFETAAAMRRQLSDGLIPTLAVIDIGLPDADGVGLIKELHAVYDIPVIAYSGSSDRITINACIKNGAIAYVPKSYDTEKLYQVIEVAISGGQFFPPSYLRNESSEGNLLALTKRQREVLELVILARTNREIAAELLITEGTVKNHVSDLLSIFGATSRNELALKTQQLRVLQ